MIILNRCFKASWLLTAITLVVVVLFIMLGLWQLDRATYKEAVEFKLESRLEEEYQRFEADDSLVDIEYRNLILEGRFDVDRSVLIDNKVFQGEAGYDVLTPFILSGSDRVVLVNRGWVALGHSREVLPTIEIPIVTNRIKGIASIPTTEGFRMGEVAMTDSWPQVQPFIDIDAMQVSFSSELLPMLLWLAPEQPGHYERNWKPVWSDPEKSRAYALQWFIFAAIAIGLYLVLNLRKLE
ncbi:MAG: surfeit locus 1 family protein [Gammaproteobacteria bacterium]|jgi:surfeit locus 1 family protein